ncbi:MAG: hypothetical protein K6A98_04495 [Prevotella sp.]|nr:hypothetical protein [Prevotella sp.]
MVCRGIAQNIVLKRQQLSESERTAAFAHTQRLQGDLSLRSYLYVYLRDKEWMKTM